MQNAYALLKESQQKEFNAFPMAFAFSNQQFDEGMRKLGLEPSEKDKIVTIDSGAFIKKTDSEAFSEMAIRHEQQHLDSIAQDMTGEGYILDMFKYELANHEFGITYDIYPALDALGLTPSQISDDVKLYTSFNNAKKMVIDQTFM